MFGLLTRLDRLSEVFSTTNGRVAVSLVAIGLVVAVLLCYQRLHARLAERARPLYADIVSMSLLITTCAMSLAVVVGVWGQTAELRRQYNEFGLGGDLVARAALSLILLVVTVIVMRFVRRLIEELMDSTAAVTEHQRQVTHRLSQVTIWSASLVIVLGIWIDDLGSLLVGAGFLGIVLGMAARQTLGTMLSGFVLMFARPFEIGDWIEVEDDEGIVTDISIVNTRVRSFDGEYIMIPNDVIASSMVTNRSKRGRLRLEVEVGVDYETDIERAAELAETAIDGVDEALTAPSPQVVAKSFGDSAVLLGVRFWIEKPSARRHWKARTAAITAVKEAFEDEDIKIPYPQRELSGRAETGGFRIADDGESEPVGKSDDGEQREHRMTTPEDN